MSLLKKLKIACAGVCLASAIGLESRLYSKNIYVPKDYATIQSAIDNSENRDRILVASGEYIINEPISYKGKNIILKSEEGAEKTIIKMENPINPDRGSVFVFENGEGNGAVLDGFKITGGNGTFPLDTTGAWGGGGIYIIKSSPTIRYNIITKNKANSGGAISCLLADNPLIIYNVISKNVGSSEGGGIYCIGSRVKILENIIKENSVWDMEGGGIYCIDSLLTVQSNILLNNYANEVGGGIFINSSNAVIQNNVIANNKTLGAGGGIGSVYSVLNLVRNTITNNSTEYRGGGISFYHEENYPHEGFIRLNCNIIWNNTGESELSDSGPSEVAYNNISRSDLCGKDGNICADPLFIDPENNDYRLQSDSPCIDVVDPDSVNIEGIIFDPDESWADMGAIYFDHSKNQFIRGDSNRDNSLDISDAVADLFYLYAGRKLECKNAADVNDDGKIDLADPIYLLDFLFKDGSQPLAPFPDGGYDLTHDKLGCYVPLWLNLETLLDGE